jgi:hypothetical protein
MPPIDNGAGKWNLEKVRFLKGNNTPLRWKLLVAPGVNASTLTDFITYFNDGIRATGVCNVGQHQGQPLQLLSLDEDTLKSQLTALLGKNGANAPDLVVLLLRARNVDAYSGFKYLTDKVFVLHSLCASATTFQKQHTPSAKTQYIANIAMKANLKRAGINHSAVGVDAFLKNTLVLGADVTHPGSGALRGSPSIAAVVGSLEASGGRFPGRMKLQPPGQEVSLANSSRSLPICMPSFTTFLRIGAHYTTHGQRTSFTIEMVSAQANSMQSCKRNCLKFSSLLQDWPRRASSESLASISPLSLSPSAIARVFSQARLVMPRPETETANQVLW